MTVTEFFDTYLLTVPMMVALAFISIVAFIATSYYYRSNPIGIPVEQMGDSKVEEAARDKLLKRQALLMLPVAMFAVGCFGTVAAML